MRLFADNLIIDRGGRRLLAGLSFALSPGEAIIVTGRNGAGKSTLLRTIAGLLRPAAGRVLWERNGAADAPIAARAHYLGHADALKGTLTAAENLAFWRALLRLCPSGPAPPGPGSSPPERGGGPAAVPTDPQTAAGGSERLSSLTAEAALARFGLDHLAEMPVRYLSAGQKRRVALARLLVAARPLWLLDEPTAALDAASRQRFAEIMRDHLAVGGLILAATHEPLGLAGAREMRLGDN